MNHVMYSGMQSWYYTNLIGLTQAMGVAGAGYAHFRVAPQVPTGLAGAALTYQTDGGEIRVQWSQGNATASSLTTRFALSVTVPVSAIAELCVPTFGRTAAQAHVTESGKEAWAAGNFSATAGCTGASASVLGDTTEICFTCGCGSYELALLI